MFQSPDYKSFLSMKLSEILEDIGVTDEMVKKRRTVRMLMDSILTVPLRSVGQDVTVYHLGSQSEGTTTKGLNSDLDILYVFHGFNVIQEWSEWKQNKTNLLMIQDENVTPGYCFLQLLNSDESLSETNTTYVYCTSDNNRRVLLKNVYTFLESADLNKNAKRCGPSNAVPGHDGYFNTDIVGAFPCNSWPQLTLDLLYGHGRERWQSMIRFADSNVCFVVGACSKISTYPNLEWRISTSITERSMMFNLNITQIQCYVLMKMIVKEFLNPVKENGISSFMCKTVLFHCIEKIEPSIWGKYNLSSCLTYCLLELHKFVQNDNCPHFIIPENNLMAGRFTVQEKHDILMKISDIIESCDTYLLRINIDDVGQRLQIKMNTLFNICYNFPTSREMYESISSILYINLAKGIHYRCLSYFQNITIEKLKKIIYNLTKYTANENRFEQFASRSILSFLYSTIGSILVSSSTGQDNPVSLIWLFFGMYSDVTSGRLKLASAIYFTGDMFRAECILRETERHIHSKTVVPVCGCWPQPIFVTAEFQRECSEQNEDCICRITSFCILFQEMEINCVPRELQYEMWRSTRDDILYRSQYERQWMDYAVVDSSPFLFFLQYKIYGHLLRYQDQQRALNKLVETTVTGKIFGHRETAFNLLGQCMEQEGKPRAALQCYMFSLQQRARNNVAKLHICKLLAKYISYM